MLKLLNTKLLIAILAALGVIASAAIYQRHEAAKARFSSNSNKRWNGASRKTKPSARRSRKTRSGTTPPLVTKDKPGRAISLKSLGRLL